MESLKRGNRQSVVFLEKGGEENRFIEANPRFKSINIYDSNMHRLGSRQAQKEKPVQGLDQPFSQNTIKESRKQGNNPEGEGGLEEPNKQARRKGQSLS